MRAVDGAYFGDSPDQEVARDNVPLHERFGIALQSPGGRGVGEHPDPVGAINAQGNAVMELAFSSFHRIGMAGHRQAGPCVISVTEAKVGTSMASLAAHSLLGPHPETYLWLMNNLDPNGEPRPGQLLKVAD
ncbi:MAG TPA: hypothetical protein VEP67_08215 [Thiobacillaceae bacterium]|nr:hypothetical protein [Thiobacillaceae bacterium]